MEKLRQHRRRERLKQYGTGAMRKGMELTQIASVGFDRVDGETTFHSKMA